MSPLEAIRSVLRSYAGFSGRARRSEYWWWSLVFTVVLVAWVALGLLVVAASGESDVVSSAVGGSYVAVYLALLVPTIAVLVRRLHDVGRSGWWYLIGFVPLGGIVLLVFTCLDSEPRPNAYGPSPKPPRAASYG